MKTLEDQFKKETGNDPYSQGSKHKLYNEKYVQWLESLHSERIAEQKLIFNYLVSDALVFAAIKFAPEIRNEIINQLENIQKYD